MPKAPNLRSVPLRTISIQYSVKAWLHKKRSRIRMWPYKNIAV